MHYLTHVGARRRNKWALPRYRPFDVTRGIIGLGAESRTGDSLAPWQFGDWWRGAHCIVFGKRKQEGGIPLSSPDGEERAADELLENEVGAITQADIADLESIRGDMEAKFKNSFEIDESWFSQLIEESSTSRQQRPHPRMFL